MKPQDTSRLAGMMLAILACGALAATPQTQPDLTQKLIQRIVKLAKGNAEAAAKLLAAAGSLKDDPKVQVAVCEAAYKYGIKTTEGCDSALAALDILDKLDAERAAIWAEKRTVAYRLRYTRATGPDMYRYGQSLVTMLLKTGSQKAKGNDHKGASALYREALTVAKRLNLPEQDDISQKLIAGVHLVNIQSAIDRLRAKLGANPDDTASRNRLIQLYLIGMDLPAEAASRLTDDCDETLRKYVPLAAKPLEELKEAQCLALAQWYEQLIDKGSTPTSKANAAARGIGCYRHFLSVHKAKDAMGVGATLAMKSLEERMKKLGGTVRLIHRNRNIFRAKDSMKPLAKGTRHRSFPAQDTDDAVGPFSGKGVYFDQKTGRDVVYEIYSSRPIRGVYYKGGAIYGTTIEFLDVRGKRIAGVGPFSGGNAWAEFTLKLPRGSPNHVLLKFHNTASGWFYIDTLKLLR